MKSYYQTAKTSFINAIAYKGETFTFIFNWFIHMGATLLLWVAVYQAGGQIQGYSLEELVVYYILVLMVAIITEVYLADEVPGEIKDGKVSSLFIKPIGLLRYYFAEVLGDKFVLFLIQLPVFLVGFGILWYLAFGSLDIPHAGSDGIILALVIALMAMVLAFFLDMFISAFAFWIDKIWSLNHFKNISFFLLGGVSFPLEFASGFFRDLLEILPFKFFYYIPVSYLNGRRDPEKYMEWDLQLLLFWILILVIATIIIWKKGIKKYGAFGG